MGNFSFNPKKVTNFLVCLPTYCFLYILLISCGVNIFGSLLIPILIFANDFMQTNKIDALEEKLKQNQANIDLANKLIDYGYNAITLKDGDLYDFCQLQTEHDDLVKNFYRRIDNDDRLDADCVWLGKALKFLIERGYLK
jgi:hypothetical protein